MASWSKGIISSIDLTVSSATKPFISSPRRTSIPPYQNPLIVTLISLDLLKFVGQIRDKSIVGQCFAYRLTDILPDRH